MEEFIRCIIAQNHEWLERVRHWFYTHGGNLSNDGSLEFIHNIKDIMENIVYVVVKTSKAGFVPDREKDELTLALSKPEHPGCTRGYEAMEVCHGSLAFANGIHNSKTRQFRWLRPSDIAYFRRPKAYVRWYLSLGHNGSEISILLMLAVGNNLYSTAAKDRRHLASLTAVTIDGGAHCTYVRRPAGVVEHNLYYVQHLHSGSSDIVCVGDHN
jgi:hypothetical protein